MMIEDRIRGVLYGLAAGDRIGGPLRMALCLSESLIAEPGFQAEGVFKRYSAWYFDGGFDTGPTASQVFRLVAQGMTVKEAVQLVDKRARGYTAGCNPMHRAIVLALSADITDDDLEEIARQEASLTHHHPLAGEVSATSVRLCRYLIQGMLLDEALEQVDTRDWLNRPLSRGGYSPDVFCTAISFLKHNDNFDHVVSNAIEFAGSANYCPVTTGALAGAIYGAGAISDHMISHCKIRDQVERVATQFIALHR